MNIRGPSPRKYNQGVLMEVTKEQTRVRVNFKVSAKGEFQPDVTSEAETVDTAMANLDAAYNRLNTWATQNGIKTEN